MNNVRLLLRVCTCIPVWLFLGNVTHCSEALPFAGLSAHDKLLTFTFTEDVPMWREYEDPTQPLPQVAGKLLMGKDAMLYILDYQYPDRPHYRSLSQYNYRQFDYQYTSNNLVFWRQIQRVGIHADNDHKYFNKFECRIISPGDVEVTDRRSSSTSVQLLTGDHADLMLHWILASAGLGFNKHLDAGAISSTSRVGSRILKQGMGSFTRHVPGIWSIEQEEGTGIVRKASIIPHQATESYLSIYTTGTLPCEGIQIAKQGEFVSYTSHKLFNFEDCRETTAEEKTAFKESLTRLFSVAQQTTGTHITDNRTSPSKEMEVGR